MDVALNPPVVEQLAPAPNRGMSSEVYPVVADKWAAGIGPWTLQINNLSTWQAAAMAATLDYKTAAGSLANQAALAASTASQAKDAAQKAVTDVGTAGALQLGLAVAAKEAAQAAAVAARAGAGIPVENVPYTMLGINGAGQLAFTWGMPDLSAARTGQAVMIGPNKKPVVGWVGAQIGDLITSARDPGALYLQAGGIYLRTVYPALSMLVGSIGTAAGKIWSYVATSQTSLSLGIATDGKGVWVRGSMRSTDNGVTWVALTGNLLGTLQSCQAMVCDGNGTWMAATYSTIIRSVDNGLTWTVVLSGTGASEAPQLATDKNGTWIFTAYSNSMRVSKDNGATWSSNITGTGSPQGVCFIGNNTWITPTGYRSVNGGVSWSLYGTPGGNPVSYAAMVYLGNNVVLLLNSGLRRSADGGYSWTTVSNISTWTGGASISHDSNGNVVVPNMGQYLVSDDYGVTWQIVAQPTGGQNGMAFSAFGMGKFIVSSHYGYTPSVETFDYDTAMQFKLPAPPPVAGVKHYIKALEAA